MNTINYYISCSVCAIMFSLQGCDSFLETDLPKDQLSRSNVFIDAHTAEAAINGMYAQIQRAGERMLTGGLTLYAGMYADEMYYFTPSVRDGFRQSALTELQDGALSLYFWQPAYQYIYAANSCLEGIQGATLDAETKNMVTAEAYFVRALAYFYLTELFGDVPLILTTNYQENEKVGRTAKKDVVSLILTDLQKSVALSDIAYRDSYKNRPNRYTIQALIARIALQNGLLELAFSNANDIIESGIYRLEDSLEDVFTRQSAETIFQLTRVNMLYNTWEATFFLPANSSSLPGYVLDADLVGSFSEGDKRSKYWLAVHNYNDQSLYYPRKYRARTSVHTEDYVLFRLAEQYLIRAEAALLMGQAIQAAADLNIVRKRSGLDEIPTGLSERVLSELLLDERRHELFAESGHRWFDLKRSGKADVILGAAKPEWHPAAIHWMIPWSQIRINPLLTQNNGYE